MRRFRSVFMLMTILVLFLSACTMQVETEIPVVEKPLPDDTARTEVFYPAYLYHLTLNPLRATQERNYVHPYDTLVFIDGLSNVEIQDRINDDLTDLYHELKERSLPPYRGIRVQITDETLLPHNNIHARVMFNHNNIISVVVENSRRYTVGNDFIHVGITETRNYDLTTGRNISLQDLFVDDCEPQVLVSDILHRQLLGSLAHDEDASWHWYLGREEAPKVVAPFRGISESPLFFLTPLGIRLIKDYRTPEFDTGFTSHPVSIHFHQLQGYLALSSRYLASESIYKTDKPPAKELLSSPHDLPQRQLLWRGREGNVYTYASARYPAHLDETKVDFIAQKHLLFRGKMNQLKSSREDLLLIQEIYAGQIGQFTVVRLSQSVYNADRPLAAYDQEDFRWWMNYLPREASLYIHCLDGEGNEVSLEALFVDGFNYREVIENAYEAQLDYYKRVAKDVPSTEEMWEDLHFSLTTNGIDFYSTVLETKEVGAGHMQIYFSLPFTQFGCENLSVFD